ncbi:ABC transporter substrate-binding protein [Myxococcus sp. K38C18041901]|uniref:ABC transporter substrate-binding protein n=1 Tax=Myxococcus guangdongensis TaxID=2906760 RepID=UPI0020A733DB|nr:ABC transporter substrate-binding protein [Myxococcus guangdongensis]MCP3061517.1 ABC transporter substrate-binding protein [Myxococcus guangdongensis]
MRVLGVLMVLASAWLGCRSASTPEDPEHARRGRMLFQRGQSVRGTPLMGFLAPERVELGGEVAACARCHGPAGRGSAEGGVEVPDITPGALFHSRPRAVGELEDRSRPAYTRDTLLRAITEGRSASGRALSVAMPRYELDDVSRRELLAYLGELGERPDPGVSPTAITVGAALPLTGRLGPAGQEAAAVLRAVFEDVNARGGVFRRRLELVVEDDAAQAPSLQADATERLLERGVFALVGSLRRGPQPSDARLTREGAPLVLPLTLRGGTSDVDSPVFFLYPDEPSLARLAVQWLASNQEPRLRRASLVVAHSGDEAGEAWTRAVKDEMTRRELPSITELILPGGLPDAWPARTPVAVLYAGAPEGLSPLLRWMEERAPSVLVLAPARLAQPEVIGPFSRQLRFISPVGLGERAPSLEDFSAFMARHGLEQGHAAFQLGAYAAARVFVEALTRTGAEVTRASLLLQLESLRDFDTGVSPPLTFGVNRRVGIQGGQLATLEPGTGRLVPASEWLPLSP